MRISVAASEVAPFSKTGGLADVAGSLPKALSRMGHDVSVFSPFYRDVALGNRRLTRTDISFPIRVGERILNARVHQKRVGRVRYFFIENPEFFDREFLYGTRDGDYPDNLERFSFFDKAVLEAMIQLDITPEIIHCHDWQTALVPIYLKEYYASCPALAGARTAFTIHNLGYQGRFPGGRYPLLGLPWEYFTPEGIEFYGQINLMKAGLVFGAALTTVSPTYAREIQTPEFGFGLDGVLRLRSSRLIGVLNGIDQDDWNPAKDTSLGANYTAGDALGKKAEIRRGLNAELGLAVEDRPLVSLVARLSEQKGLELVTATANEIVGRGANIAVLGTGDERYHRLLRELQLRFPGSISLNLKFDEKLAHRLYAASDIFLIPSRYEPCGLGQLIALRYGAVPVGFRTGGLADTIVDCELEPQTGNGFLFDEYTPAALLDKVSRALALRANPAEWKLVVERGMKVDSSWQASATKYEKLFREELDRKPTPGVPCDSPGPGIAAGIRHLPTP